MKWMIPKIYGINFLLLTLSGLCLPANAEVNQDLQRLQQAYPDFIKSVSNEDITWSDGAKMPVHEGKVMKSQQEKMNSPSLADQVEGVYYSPGKPVDTVNYRPNNDAGRIRYMPFFEKMYGNTEAEVKNKLVIIYWMPKFFGKKYPLQVTTVNQVDKQFKQVSAELEKLLLIHPEFRKFLEHPGGTFKWRKVANTDYLSSHGFGIAIDLNPKFSNYWQWDLQKMHQPVNEEANLGYQNHIPWEIVLAFEKYGFIWGGKWRHYDTMHFEYRPELLMGHR